VARTDFTARNTSLQIPSSVLQMLLLLGWRAPVIRRNPHRTFPPAARCGMNCWVMLIRPAAWTTWHHPFYW